MSFPLSLRWIVTAILTAATASCSTWRQVERFDGWDLYADEGFEAPVQAFERTFEPAHAAVERLFGPFTGRVRVFAVPDESDSDFGEGETGLVQEVPGIGKARVRAFHSRGDSWFGSLSGIYSGVPDAGTAAHEFVHARVAEQQLDLPLWFEEGLACIVGDGFLDQDQWIIDGYACWPVKELREQRLTEAEVARLLGLKAENATDPRDNVLVHFVGWAVVFDLMRESGGYEWRTWIEQGAPKMSASEALMRLERSLSKETEARWLERLASKERSVRMATGKGVWKLRSTRALESLLDAIEVEKDLEVRVGLSINALAAAGEMKLDEDLSDRMWRTVWPALRRATLEDTLEQSSLKGLTQSFWRRTRTSSQQALEGLRRFWAE